MRIWIGIFLLWPLTGFAQGPDMSGPRINDFKAGIFCAPEVIETQPAPGTVSGETNIIKSTPEFVSTGRNVPAVLGMGLGVKSVAKGYFIPDVTVVVTHPPLGPNGATSQTYMTSIQSTRTSISLYQFDYNYELVLGPWTVSAYDGDELLYRANFNVVSPELVPELASVCNYEHLLG